MSRHQIATLLVLALALALSPAQGRQVVALVDDAAGRAESLSAGRLHRLLLSDIEPGDHVQLLLGTAAWGEAPASLVTLVSFRAHHRPAIRNAQLLAAAQALGDWRRSEASHSAPEQPGSLAPLLVRSLREHVATAEPLRLILAGRLTVAPPPDGATLRAALPSTSTVTLVDLTPRADAPGPEAPEGEAEGSTGGDGGDAEQRRSTFAEWRTALAAAGARWQPAPWD